MVENKKLFSPEDFDKPEHTSTSKKDSTIFFNWAGTSLGSWHGVLL